MPINVFTVTLAGELLGTFDENELTLTDALTLENTTGLTFPEMMAGISPRQPVPLRALVWFMRYKQGNPPHISTIDFKLVDLTWAAVENPTRAEDSVSETSPADTSETPTSEL